LGRVLCQPNRPIVRIVHRPTNAFRPQWPDHSMAAILNGVPAGIHRNPPGFAVVIFGCFRYNLVVAAIDVWLPSEETIQLD
jgi:hypothetical protein